MIYLPRRIAAALVAGLALLGTAPTNALAQGYFLRSAEEPKNTAIVMDAKTGEILYGERADSVRYPASVTKVMTLYLTFQALSSGRLHLNDLITVSPLAASQPPTKLGLRAGETITVQDAMYAMAVHSANDMAVAISEKVGGTESNFASMMTLKAQQLGMLNTRYVNANGLPDSRQTTTAHDQAILVRAVLRDFPQYYGFFGQQSFTYAGRTYANTNHLLGRMPGVDGLKTGFTNAAGSNLAASAVRNGHRLIVVAMGQSSSAIRNANVEGLLLTGFDVMERRDRGERVQMAQVMFNRPSTIYSARGAPSEDDDPIDVMLTKSTAQPAPIALSNSMAQARAEQAADSIRKASATSGAWWVQVGAFRSREAARSQVETVARQFGKVFASATGSVDGGGRQYVARFSGFSETGAREACGVVKSRGVPCVAGGRA